MRPPLVAAFLVGIVASVPGARLWASRLAQDAPPLTLRDRAVQGVRDAMVRQERGEFAAARRVLDSTLVVCGGGADGLDCRVLVNTWLGTVLQRQAAVDRSEAEALLRQAVNHYDEVLRESPDQPNALYGKAIAYRGLGPHEWQEQFFRTAPERDPERRTTYLAFQGDYYASTRRWSEAADAYRRGLEADPDDDGARAGLIDALASLRGAGTRELLDRARHWEVRYPGSAAEAYEAVLAATFTDSAGAPPDARARAYLGLVEAQARTGRTIGTMPTGVPADWAPAAQLRAFLWRPGPGAVSWWRTDQERRMTLGAAALVRGKQFAADGQPAEAERMWQEALSVTGERGNVSIDLERELALLYTRHPALDPEGRKFRALEHEIFRGKTEAIGRLSVDQRGGDLETVQRYHTTLGLIYVERKTWTGPYARSASIQLTWALQRADERWRAERFYQPVPELRELLAAAHDSAGDRARGRVVRLEAARAYLDMDDTASARRVMAHRSLAGIETGGVTQVLGALREPVARRCTAGRLATLSGAGLADFASRQRFKILADCPAEDRRARAAFWMVDSLGVPLIGLSDVRRFETVVKTLIGPYAMTFSAGHLEPSRPDEGGVSVTLPGQTRGFWIPADHDALVAARVVRALGPGRRPFALSVIGGQVVVSPEAGLVPADLERLRGVRGVRSVRVGEIRGRRGGA